MNYNTRGYTKLPQTQNYSSTYTHNDIGIYFRKHTQTQRHADTQPHTKSLSHTGRQPHTQACFNSNCRSGEVEQREQSVT